MIVHVLSKIKFDNTMRLQGITDDTIESITKTCFISIGCSESVDPKFTELHPYFKKDHSNVLNLMFDDVEEPTTEEHANEFEKLGVILFNEQHARRIIEFIEQNKDKEKCIVHCAAGISRSGAVGEYINDYFGTEDHNKFKLRNPHTMPNQLVLRTLKRIAKGD